MATARERSSIRVYERIPGKDAESGAGGKYAFMELEAGNVSEFETLRAEAEKSPAFVRYDFDGSVGRKILGREVDEVDSPVTATQVVKAAAAAAKAKTPAKNVEAAAAEPNKVGSADAEKAPTGEAESSAPVTPSAPASTSVAVEGSGSMTPLEIARAKLLAKKEGK